MKIEMDIALQELIENGTSKEYRSSAEELKMYSFLHYERLKFEYSGLSSVRLDNRYVHRLLFEEKEDRITLRLIKIDDTHYGN